MAELEYVVVYAVAYPTVAAARAVLDTIEHLNKDEVNGPYDAAVVEGERQAARRQADRPPAHPHRPRVVRRRGPDPQGAD